MSNGAFPAYLLHAPFLSVGSQLLQRTLPPSPLYYLHPAPAAAPGSVPPALALSTAHAPVSGRVSTVYRATSTSSGTRVILKYSSRDPLALVKEAEDVFVNLPYATLPIPTYYGQFLGRVEPDQDPGVVTVLEDCGEPLPSNSFDSLTLTEKRYLYSTLETLHDIHFSLGHFSPASVVVSSSSSSADVATPSSPPRPTSTTTTTTPSTTPPPPPPTTTTTTKSDETKNDDDDDEGPLLRRRRKLTLVGFSQAEWHLCPGSKTCPELLNAKRALGLV